MPKEKRVVLLGIEDVLVEYINSASCDRHLPYLNKRLALEVNKGHCVVKPGAREMLHWLVDRGFELHFYCFDKAYKIFDSYRPCKRDYFETIIPWLLKISFGFTQASSILGNARFLFTSDLIADKEEGEAFTRISDIVPEWGEDGVHKLWLDKGDVFLYMPHSDFRCVGVVDDLYTTMGVLDEGCEGGHFFSYCASNAYTYCNIERLYTPKELTSEDKRRYRQRGLEALQTINSELALEGGPCDRSVKPTQIYL